jgi:glycosyltransferase involved in cell wall biosynthesis
VPSGAPNPLLLDTVRDVKADFAIGAWGSEKSEGSEKSDLWQACEDRGIPFIELGKSGNVLQMAYALRRAIRLLKPDVVEAHTLRPSVCVAILATMMKTRPGMLAVRHHNLNHHLKVNRTARWADRFVNSRADGVVAVSYAVRGTCIAEGLDPDRCHVALNGLDLEHFVSRSSTGVDFRRRAQYLLLAVGRIDWQKDYPTMLRSLAHLVSRGIDAELAILGSGLPGYETEMINLSDQLALKERVHWMGWQSDVPAWMHSADLFVHSAVDEACGLVLIEALASGLPIVATAAGGSREVVQPFYEPVQSGDPVAFADEIENNLQNLSERRLYAASICSRAIRRFAPKPMAEAHLRACIKVMRSRRG